jgi:hypothetical protein
MFSSMSQAGFGLINIWHLQTIAPTHPSWRFTSGAWPNHHSVDHANSPRAEPRDDYWIRFGYARSQAAETDIADLFAQTVSTTPGAMTQLFSTMKTAATSLTNTYYTSSLPRSIDNPLSLSFRTLKLIRPSIRTDAGDGSTVLGTRTATSSTSPSDGIGSSPWARSCSPAASCYTSRHHAPGPAERGPP